MVRAIPRPTARNTPNRTKTIKFSAQLFVPQQAIGEGKSLDQVYSIDFDKDKIEEGSKSVIYKCIHKESGEERAIKIVEKSSWNDEEDAGIKAEIELLRKMDHPNIVRVFSTFEDEKYYYIVMDYCKGGELRDQMIRGTGLSEFYVAVLVKTILTSINYCFTEHNVIHLGLKPENILLEGHRQIEFLKIIDFGNSMIAPTATKTDRLIGSAAYLAPESLNFHTYSHKTDIWAIGVIAFMGLSGNLPFDASTDRDTLELILNSKEEVVNKDIFKDGAWATVSDDAIDFVSKLLAFESFKRPSAQDALQHPWIQRVTEAQAEVILKRDKAMAQNALEEMFRFQAPSKLQQAALTYIASQCISKFDKGPIEQLFQAMDVKHTGKLTRGDFQKAHAQFMGDQETELTQGELKELFAHVGFMDNKSIDYSEFLVASLPKHILLADDNIQKVFKTFDKDGDGKISADDLKQVLKELLHIEQEGMDEYIRGKILKEVTTDEDGKIGFEAFAELLENTKNGAGRDPHRRKSDQMTSEEFKIAQSVETISISGNTFDQFRAVFERKLKEPKA